MTADPSSSPEEPSQAPKRAASEPDADALSDDAMEGWATDDDQSDRMKPRPISPFAKGRQPDLTGKPKSGLGDSMKPSSFIQSDVTQESATGRKDPGIRQVEKVFDDLEKVDSREMMAARKAEGATKGSGFKTTSKSDEEHRERQQAARARAPKAESLERLEVPSLGKLVSAATGRSIFEKLSWLVLLAALVAFVVMVVVPAVRDLPEKEATTVEKFPVEGEFLTVRSANTYWREPMTEGPDADTFRRGMVLLPALELHVEGGPAAIRVLFRGANGLVVGDSVLLPVEEGRVMEIPATAGFEDFSLFSEYRANEDQLWTVEVFEGGSVNDDMQDFNKLFEINIEPILK